MRRRVFLIENNPERGELLRQSLHLSAHEIAGTASADGDFLPALQTTAPDLLMIVCDAPSGTLLARLRDLAQHRPLPVVLFTKDDNRTLIQQALHAGVSAYVIDGLAQQRLGSILDVAVARFQETRRLRAELEATRAELADRKNIERAKGILMKQRGFDEPTAYHALRKMAMDRNLRIGQVAEHIIAVTELLN